MRCAVRVWQRAGPGMAVVLTAILLAAGVLAGLAQDRKARAVKEFMRDKLELSQRILEALALEDFDGIASRAQRLSAMSQESTWQVFENPDYAQYSLAFRKNVDALARAARAKNLDGATLAYMRATMSCVDCHKYVRGRLVARAEDATKDALGTPSRPALAGTLFSRDSTPR